MAKKKTNDIERLLAELDKSELADFIRRECANDRQFQDRFLALGAGTLFRPDAKEYATRVKDLIKEYGGRHGYIEYRDTFDFNQKVSRILEEAEAARLKGKWEIAVAALTGIASVAEDIIDSGDDSAGELGGIVEDCFYQWHELCAEEELPENVRSEVFELALARFEEKDLKGWDWWWDWMEMAVELADTPDRQGRVLKALDAIIRPMADDWKSRHDTNMAQKYKLELMSRSGSVEDQIRFLRANVSNPDFRTRLLQMSWDKGDYEEVLTLAERGALQDREYPGLVNQWNTWRYRAFREVGDTENQLSLARHFFFVGTRISGTEFTRETMYSDMKSLVPQSEWPEYVKGLVSEAIDSRNAYDLLYIYRQEQMWEEYMAFIRKNPSTHNIEEAPQEVKGLFREEIVELYASGIRSFFQSASDRHAYRTGVGLLRNLIDYGGEDEARQIAADLKACYPRRSALLDELSKL